MTAGQGHQGEGQGHDDEESDDMEGRGRLKETCLALTFLSGFTVGGYSP
jgi:hypothetical protein